MSSPLLSDMNKLSSLLTNSFSISEVIRCIIFRDDHDVKGLDGVVAQMIVVTQAQVDDMARQDCPSNLITSDSRDGTLNPTSPCSGQPSAFHNRKRIVAPSPRISHHCPILNKPL